MPVNKLPGLPPSQRVSSGFTLGEMLLALLFTGMIFLAAGQFFPQLFQQSRRLQQQQQLAQEVHQLMLIFEKNLRRAGYCQQAPCIVPAITISQDGHCLIVRGQERRFISAGPGGALHNESYGYRWRAGQIETQRSVTGCQGSGWERLTDPATLQVDELTFIQQVPRIGIHLRVSAGPHVSLQRWHWLLAENL